MAVSEKYVTFSKLSKDKGGLLAKPFNIDGGTYYSFEVSITSCFIDSPFTLYSDSENLIVGSVLYTNTSLTTRYSANEYVYYNGYSYTILQSGESTGEITSIDICFTGYSGYTDCSELTEYTLYVNFDTLLVIGNTLYTDSALTEPLVSGEFVYEGSRYITSSTGEIIDVILCAPPYNFTAYTDCDLLSPITIYLNEPISSPIPVNTMLLNADNTPFTGTSFVYEYNIYEYSTATGVGSSTPCGS